jgi:hypothetical protein
VAYSLASRHFQSVGRPRTAAWHLSEAQDAYAAWGASAVVQRLPAVPWHQQPGRRRLPSGPSSAYSSSSSTEADQWAATTLDTLKQSSYLEHSLDVRAVLAASQTLSSEIVRESLMEKLLNIVLEVAGARYVVLVLQRPGEGDWYVEGSASVAGRVPGPQGGPGGGEILTQVAPVPLGEAGGLVPQALVLYVSRTQEVVMLKEVEQASAFKDAYLERRKPQSVLCMPIVRHGGEPQGPSEKEGQDPGLCSGEIPLISHWHP